MANTPENPSPKVTEPDCPYCGQVGGVSLFDTMCQEHNVDQAIGWVKEGRFYPAEKKP